MNKGTTIEHDKFGFGVVHEVGLTSFKAIFKLGGEREILLTSKDFEVLEENAGGSSSNSGVLDVNALEKMMVHVLDKYNGLQENVELGDRWTGGTLEIKPGDTSLKSKEIPIEDFFHKIVMLRDRLRVLEQNINSHKKLSEEEKVHMQQYITKCYGSLTTFNVLFKHKEDQFVGEKSNV